MASPQEMCDDRKQDDSGSDTGMSDSIPSLPPPPAPSGDPELIVQTQGSLLHHTFSASSSAAPLFEISPMTALKMLCAGIDTLISVTDDFLPTPPHANTLLPNSTSMKQEETIARLRSERNVTEPRSGRATSQTRHSERSSMRSFSDARQSQPVDGVRLRHASTPPRSTPASQLHIIIGEGGQPLHLQHYAITRKFFSKAPPSMSIEAYLTRIHRFCPMSTGVYLAASYYLFRLAVQERVIAITARNCHRLLLAGLRVAMKALEDDTYSHAKFAKVGGVSDAELARLEICFCFLAQFRLVVDGETMVNHWNMLQKRVAVGDVGSDKGVTGIMPNLGVDVPC